MKKNAGYMTVEATLIVSVMLMSLFAIMYSFMLLYQNLLVEHAVTAAANYGSEICCGKSNVNKPYSIYGRPNSDDKAKIKNYAEGYLKKSLLSVESTTIDVNEVQLMGWKEGIRVDITQTINIPANAALSRFGVNIGVFEASATSEISNSAETIRNVDLAVETALWGVNKITDIIENFVKIKIGG